MGFRIRKNTIMGLLAQLNVVLEDTGYSLRYDVQAKNGDRPIWYRLCDAKTGQHLSDWMGGREMYRTMQIILASLPLLKEPTPYQTMLDKLHKLNDASVLAESPYRFRIDGPHGGRYRLARLAITDGTGKETIYSEPYTEQGMVRYIAILMVNLKSLFPQPEEQTL